MFTLLLAVLKYTHTLNSHNYTKFINLLDYAHRNYVVYIITCRWKDIVNMVQENGTIQNLMSFSHSLSTFLHLPVSPIHPVRAIRHKRSR